MTSNSAQYMRDYRAKKKAERLAAEKSVVHVACDKALAEVKEELRLSKRKVEELEQKLNDMFG